MLSPIKFELKDFIDDDFDARAVKSIEQCALSGSNLIDNLILLRFVDLPTVQEVLKEKYSLSFAWLNRDLTPQEFRAVATKYHVIIQKSRSLVVYVPLGITLDDVALQVEIPNYVLEFRYIADCNYKILQKGLSPTVLTSDIAYLDPLLVFRRLILDCIKATGTDLHFESFYVDKKPYHTIQYRVKRELVKSEFSVDYPLLKAVIQDVIAKLTPASAMDIDAPEGITTEVRDLFDDGSCDLRITCMRVDAGYYMVIAIQTISTTNMTLDELGLPKDDVQVIRELAKRRTGLTLITGEMRSGKNTTIFAMLNEIINEPIRIIEYSNPVENHMSFPQINYRGDINVLSQLMRMAKKQDIDIAVLNEIPNSEVAFAVRDLVNSSIGVITTTHLNRLWHLPNKLLEFFGDDYKTIISQLNVVINHRMFRRWECPNLQKRVLVKEQGDLEFFAYKAGVRQYFVPANMETVKYSLQPLVEYLVFDDAIKDAVVGNQELWRSEQLLKLRLEQSKGTLENKVAAYVNQGLMSLNEFRKLL